MAATDIPRLVGKERGILEGTSGWGAPYTTTARRWIGGGAAPQWCGAAFAIWKDTDSQIARGGPARANSATDGGSYYIYRHDVALVQRRRFSSEIRNTWPSRPPRAEGHDRVFGNA